MGNQTSNEGGGGVSTPAARPSANIKNFLRQTGSLGLSKSELDERCKHSG
jgi:hypothetical protein